jgi:hypothetical protein
MFISAISLRPGTIEFSEIYEMFPQMAELQEIR